MTKSELYEHSINQITGVISGESNQIANLANIAAILHRNFNWWWTGFYHVDGNELILGPFQGPVACTRIKFGKGVCGTSWEQKKSILVKNVHDFPGHIACSEDSLSEIVIPIFKGGEIIMVLDVDSELEAHFDEEDQKYLEHICRLISTFC